MQQIQKSLTLINLLCIFLFLFLLLYIYTKYYIFWDIFTVRDIQRAVGWLEGRFYWPGPEMSKGGNLPGPLFYFLLFPPLLFGENTYSQSLLWHITWLSFTYTTAFYFITKITAHKESVSMFLILFLVTFKDGCLELLKFAWNPSFAIVFHIFIIMGLYFWRKTDKDFYLYLTGLAIALGVQIHLFVLVHIITIVLFYCLAQKKNWKPILLFSLFVSSPFFIFSMMNYLNVFEISASHPYYSLIYVVRNIFSEKWLNNTNSLFSFNYAIPIGFLFCLTLGMKQKTKKQLITPLTRDLFFIIIIPCLTGILMARRGWYLYFIPVFLIFFFSKWFDDLMSHNKTGRYRFLIICTILFIISHFLFGNITYDLSISHLLSKTTDFYFTLPAIPLTVFLFMNKGGEPWREHFGKTSLLLLFCFFIMQVKVIERFRPHKKSVPESLSRLGLSYQDISPLMKRIYVETNWFPKEAMKRLFIIGASPTKSLRAYYSMTKEQVDKETAGAMETDFNPSKITDPSSRGYIIIQHLKKFVDYSHADWKQYLSHSLLSHVLQKEIKEEKILLETPKLYGTYWLIPYQTSAESFFQEGFSNIGQPYYWEEPEWLKNCTLTQHFKKKYEFYYCMVLPGHLRRAGVYMKLSDKSPNEFTPSSTLDITFSGPIIGTADCCSNYWHTFWSDSHILISCNKKRILHSLPSMGLPYTLPVTSQAKQFSAPLKLSIPVKKSAEFPGCNRDEIKTIELTFHMRRDLTFNMYNFAPMEQKRIIWERNY